MNIFHENEAETAHPRSHQISSKIWEDSHSSVAFLIFFFTQLFTSQEGVLTLMNKIVKTV